MNKKNNKGITLVALSITIIVLIIITSITIYSSKNHISVKYLNYLYGDLDTIKTKTAAYYLKTGNLPVFDNAFIDTQDELEDLLIQNGANSEGVILNPNDERKILCN